MKKFIERLSPSVQDEYELAKLLKVFKSLCDQALKNKHVEQDIRRLYRKSTNELITTRNVFKAYCNYSVTEKERELLCSWIKAFLRKQKTRKPIPQYVKQRLKLDQGNKCAICKKTLNSNDSMNHVDHIIPFKYVGDELDNNYQVLCDGCNKHKSSRTDYIFMYLLDLA